jgi:hypothetical protein
MAKFPSVGGGNRDAILVAGPVWFAGAPVEEGGRQSTVPNPDPFLGYVGQTEAVVLRSVPVA